MEGPELEVEIKSEDGSHLDDNASTPLRQLGENDDTPLRTDVIASPDHRVFGAGGSGHGWESDNDDVEVPSIPRTPRSDLTMPNSPTNAANAEPEAPVVKAEPENAESLDDILRDIPKLEEYELGGTASNPAMDGIPSVFCKREEMNDMDLEPPQAPAPKVEEPDCTDSIEELEATRLARQKELQELDDMQELKDKHKKRKRKHKRKRGKSGSNSSIDENQKENKRTSRESRRTSEEHQRDNRRQHEDSTRDNRRHREDNLMDSRRQHEDNQREKRPRDNNQGDNRRDHETKQSDNRRDHEDKQRDSKRHRDDHYRDNKRPREDYQMDNRRPREDNHSEVRGSRDPTIRVTASYGLPRVATIKPEPMPAVGADFDEEWIYVRDDERQIKVVNHEKLFQQEQSEAVPVAAKPAPEKLTKREKCNLAVNRAMKVLELFEQKRTNAQEEEFLMVNTIHKVPKSSSFMSQEVFENPSPICNNYNVVYEFNSAPGTRIDLAKWGLETVPNSTRDLLRLLSYDVDHLKQARLKTQPSQRILKLKQEQLFNAPSEPEESDSAALYINSSTQTDLRLHTQSVGTQAQLQGQLRGAFWQNPDFDMTFLTTAQTNVMFALQELIRNTPTPEMANRLYKALQPALDVHRDVYSRK
ncbi:protein panoramix [Drosophila obscura]|uniref:protein panoramix n=1 Tax=Drosophila obscura TaxID=7282 RepID=UPI001BB1D201|nr:protein panoramix [Drosophila obscura]